LLASITVNISRLNVSYARVVTFLRWNEFHCENNCIKNSYC
jgi:hypothetical protein